MPGRGNASREELPTVAAAEVVVVSVEAVVGVALEVVAINGDTPVNCDMPRSTVSKISGALCW